MHTEAEVAGRPWTPTRAEASRRLAAFVPRAGRTYAAQRNEDRGPHDRTNVSTLSPYVRHRLLTETEVLEAVLARHSATAAEKFVAEVFWRTYWKGWLQAHPAAWHRYRTTLAAARAACEASPEMRRDVARAVGAQTGIDAFDAWAHELVTVNYLHNHARMWFASIWIFTLHLPWELGADFFMRNLLDGDPAANTLSWRWVAGLHTRGKTYAATRANIRHYTGERFVLVPPLARAAPALHDENVPLEPPSPIGSLPAGPPALLLVHDDDLHADARELPAGLRGVYALTALGGRSPAAIHPAVRAFTAGAAADATARIATEAGIPDLGLLPEDLDPERTADAVAAATKRCGAARVIAPLAPVGPVCDRLAALERALGARGIALDRSGRDYDRAAWPAARGGFFGLRGRIPAILAELGIGAG